MATNHPTGRATPMTMADFNARAKRIAESTGAVEKGDTHRSRPSRFRRDVNGGIPAVPKGDKSAG